MIANALRAEAGTAMLESRRSREPENAAENLSMCPLARFGQPHEVAEASCFPAGPAGGRINRESLTVDVGILSPWQTREVMKRALRTAVGAGSLALWPGRSLPRAMG